MTIILNKASLTLSDEEQQRLTVSLEKYLDMLEKGENIDIDRVCEEFPELAHTLKESIPKQTQPQSEENALSRYQAREENKNQAAEGNRAGEENDRPSAGPTYRKTHGRTPKQLGDFELIEEIGRGGMGMVFKAKQVSLDRIVAVKILSNAATWDCKQIARFQNEAQAAAQLSHPNIVSVYSVGNENGTYFYSMPLIEGISLERAVRTLQAKPNFNFEQRASDRGGKGSAKPMDDGDAREQMSLSKRIFGRLTENALDEEETTPVDKNKKPGTSRAIQSTQYVRAAVELVAQAAEALHFAHQHGIVHRDIKPSNLLIDRHGNLWITDFGLAMMAGQSGLTEPGDVMGTPRYMSPEQTSGNSDWIDHRTDIYSLGVTLYELLTLHAAVDADDRMAMLKQIKVQSPTSARSRNSAVSKTLEIVLSKAISKYPEERYGNAQLFAEDLRRFLANGRSLAKESGLSQNLVRFVRRHPRGSLLATMLFMLLLAVMTPALGWMAFHKINLEVQVASANHRLRTADEALEQLTIPLLQQLRLRPGTESLQGGVRQSYAMFLESLLEHSQHDAAFRSQAGSLQRKVANLHEPGISSQAALEEYEQAKNKIAQWVSEDSTRASPVDLFLVHDDLANLRFRLGLVEPAAIELKSFLEAGYQESLWALQTDATPRATLEALVRLDYGLALALLGSDSAAEREFVGACTLVQAKTGASSSQQPSSKLLNQKLVMNLLRSASLDTTSPELARRLIESAISIANAARTNKNNSMFDDHQLAQCFLALGLNTHRLGNEKDAVQWFGKASKITEQLVNQDPSNFRFWYEHAASLNSLGQAELGSGNREQARLSLQRSIHALENISRLQPDANYQSSLATALHDLAAIAIQDKQNKDARDLLARAVREQESALQIAPENPHFKNQLQYHQKALSQLEETP
ncbi:MAG: protein kinase domain-containing protein [Planctomycetota bacterium]|jgi:serine/threonine protein kinase/tetratricopeptide (TPR) repeat protein